MSAPGSNAGDVMLIGGGAVGLAPAWVAAAVQAAELKIKTAERVETIFLICAPEVHPDCTGFRGRS
jgi:hypothetical protein